MDTPYCCCLTTCTIPYNMLSPDVEATAAELKPSYIRMEVSVNQAQQQQAAQGLGTHQQLSGTEAATAAENRRETGLTRLLIGMATSWHGNRNQTAPKWHAQLLTTLLTTAGWQGTRMGTQAEPGTTALPQITDTKAQEKCKQNATATQNGTGTATRNKHQGGTPTAEQKTHLLQKTGPTTPAAEWHKVGIPAAGQGAEGDMIEHHLMLPYTQQKPSGQTTTVTAHSTRSQGGTESHSSAQLARTPDDDAYLTQPPAQPPNAKKALHTRRLPHPSSTATLTDFRISFLCLTGIRRTSNSAQPPRAEQHYIVPVPMPPTDSTAHNCCHFLHRLKAKRIPRGRRTRKITAAWQPPPALANHAARPHSSLLQTTSPHTHAELSGKAANNQPEPPANINAPTAHQKEAESLMRQMLLLLLYVCTKICSKLLHCCINYTILSCILFVETATTRTAMRRFLLLTVLHTPPCQENSSRQFRLFCDTVYADEQIPLGESCRGMSLNIHCKYSSMLL